MVTSSGGEESEFYANHISEPDSSKEYAATVIGYDKSADLAVIKIDETNLTPIEIRRFGFHQCGGDIAIAIGNPGGLGFYGFYKPGHHQRAETVPSNLREHTKT